MSKDFYVEAVWDPEASVFVSKSNIPGLVVEAATSREFFEIVHELAPELLRANLTPKSARKGQQQRVPVRYQFTDEFELACA
jgi:hypothetical protein